MVYFNFTYITDPPNDELVDPSAQLNNNWQEVADKIDGFNKLPNEIVNPPVGTEAFYPLGTDVIEHRRIAVYNGTTWIRSLSHGTGWTAWTAFPLRSPVTERSGFTPVIRANTMLRLIQVSGGVIYNSGAAWPTGSDIEITTDAGISTVNQPIGGLHHNQLATAQIMTAGGFASAVARVQLISSPNHVGIFIRWQGDSLASGNFVMLDGLSWWY